MKTTFDSVLLPLYRAAVFADGQTRATIAITSDQILRALSDALEKTEKFGVALAPGETIEPAVGVSVSLDFGDPRTGLGLLAGTFADVLRFPGGTVATPKYFLIDKRVAYSDVALLNIPEAVRYGKALDLVQLLGASAAYFDKDSPELVFLKEGKVSVPVSYQVEDLLAIDVPALDSLLSRFQDSTHLDQKRAMLTESVLKQCAGVEPQRRFAVLLSHLKEALKSFDESYRLFMADFSYEKVRDELQSAKIEELTKIHKTFSDVQGQILGIPVATVLVATQMKVAATWDAVAWINCAVLAGVWVFAVLMVFVMRNQRHTLDAIDQEIKRKKQKIETTYAPVKDLVTEIFPVLVKRLHMQRCAFITVDIVVVAGLILAHIMFFAMTEPAARFLFSILA
jgi:hypothetical protein